MTGKMPMTNDYTDPDLQICALPYDDSYIVPNF
jgi:hypothetical protein